MSPHTPQLAWHDWLPQWAPALAVLCGLVSAVFYVGGELKRLDHLEQGQLRSEERLEQRMGRMETRLEQRMARMETRLGQRMVRMEEHVARMETRMETLFGELRTELADDRRNVGNDVTALREGASALEAKDT